jgi:hypothetical protein
MQIWPRWPNLGQQVVKFNFQGDDFVRSEQYFLLRLLSERIVRRNAKDEAQFVRLWLPLSRQ